jgi:acetyltransferase-like isoleucine patch superfamily enzyme
MSLLKKIKNRIRDLYVSNILFTNNKIRTDLNSKMIFGKNVKIQNSKIFLSSDSVFIVGDNTKIQNCSIYIKGSCIVGKNNIIGEKDIEVSFRINGKLKIEDFNKISAQIWMRFKSFLKIGSYNNINKKSQIRGDEKIIIGDFNQISYNVKIWDTNTHNIYKYNLRRNLTKKHYPSYGYEYEKPKTKPVVIGDDNWIGENVSLLKGTTIQNRVIVAYGCFITNFIVESNHTVTNKVEYNLYDNKI